MTISPNRKTPRMRSRPLRSTLSASLDYPDDPNDLAGFVDAWWAESKRRAALRMRLNRTGRTLPKLGRAMQRGSLEDRERRHWDGSLKTQFRKAINAAAKCQKELSKLRQVERQRPRNEPDLAMVLEAAADDVPARPIASELGRDIDALETFAGQVRKVLETWYAGMRPGLGRRKDARRHALEAELERARIGDHLRAQILISEGFDKAAESTNPRADADRLAKRRRRAKPGRK